MNGKTPHGDVPLRSVPNLSQTIIGRLEGKGIQSANQVLEISTMPNGVAHLTEELQLSTSEVDAALTLMRSALSPKALDSAKRPLDISKFGLGGRLDEPNDVSR
jgi:hypothetical protein